MLNILIQETDQFFHHGLQCFFVEFFLRNFKQQIHFEAELSRDNVSSADIIVLSFCMGEALVCFPELQARQKGIVIGLVEDEYHFSTLPSCFNDIIFIGYTDLMVDGAPSPHQSDTTLRWLIDRLRS